MHLPLIAIEKAEHYCGDHNMDTVCICDLKLDPESWKDFEIESLEVTLENSIEEDAVKRQEITCVNLSSSNKCSDHRMICVEKMAS